MKVECSKLLRSSQADHDYIFLLCRLCRNLSEPFWSRAQQQLKLILQFRNSDSSPANVPVRLLILDDEMESQMRSWLKGFIVHHQVSFPPFILLIRYTFTVLVNGMSCWFGHFWITTYLLTVMLPQYRQYNRFAIQYLSGFLRNSVRVTFYQSLVVCSKRLDPLSTIAHRGRGSWAKLLVSRYWKYSTLCILIFWNFRMYMPYLNKFACCSELLHLMNVSLKSINLT